MVCKDLICPNLPGWTTTSCVPAQPQDNPHISPLLPELTGTLPWQKLAMITEAQVPLHTAGLALLLWGQTSQPLGLERKTFRVTIQTQMESSTPIPAPSCRFHRIWQSLSTASNSEALQAKPTLHTRCQDILIQCCLRVKHRSAKSSCTPRLYSLRGCEDPMFVSFFLREPTQHNHRGTGQVQML